MASIEQREIDSFISIHQEYNCEDFDQEVKFIERRLCTNSSGPTDGSMSFYPCATINSDRSPEYFLNLDKNTLREKLIN